MLVNSCRLDLSSVTRPTSKWYREKEKEKIRTNIDWTNKWPSHTAFNPETKSGVGFRWPHTKSAPPRTAPCMSTAPPSDMPWRYRGESAGSLAPIWSSRGSSRHQKLLNRPNLVQALGCRPPLCRVLSQHTLKKRPHDWCQDRCPSEYCTYVRLKLIC